MDSQFAQKEMSKRGWKSGQGLGRKKNGMKDAIKVKRKGGTEGLGHNLGDEFTFHWWDHIFNKAANSIKVDENEGDDGVTITTERSVGPVSFKKPLSRNMQGRELMYGMFVKAGTYVQSLKTSGEQSASDEEDPFAFSSDPEDSADEEDLSCQDTLERTFKLTGMTGHKGARHGQTMSGKLSRIMEQESKINTPVDTPIASPVQSDKDEANETPAKKKKKKRKKEKAEQNIINEPCNDEPINGNDHLLKNKKKKKKPATLQGESNTTNFAKKKSAEVDNIATVEIQQLIQDTGNISTPVVDQQQQVKKKKRMRKNLDVEGETHMEGDFFEIAASTTNGRACDEECALASNKPKKKSKKSKSSNNNIGCIVNEMKEGNYTSSAIIVTETVVEIKQLESAFVTDNCEPKKKKQTRHLIIAENDIEGGECDNLTVLSPVDGEPKKKKKKKNRNKDREEFSRK